MKIVHTLWSLGTGGTESMLADIASEQVKDNDVFIIIINNVVSKQVLNRIDDRCKILCCHRKVGSKNPLPLLRFNYYLWKIHADIIHVHMENLGLYLWACRGAKKVRTIHCAFGNATDYKYYDKLFSISEGVRKYTLKQGFESTVVYNGIHPEQIKFAAKDNGCGGTLKIVNVGRLQEVKGQQLLIEAANLLLKAGFSAFKIDLIGDGENRRNLEQMVEYYQLSPYIRFLGMMSRDYVYTHLCDYNLYIQPSLSEGFGLTLAEAMAAGVPVLTSDQEGPMEVIGQGKYGSSFSTGNSQELCNCILKHVEQSFIVSSVESRQYICCNFDIKQTSRKYIVEYQNLIRKKYGK